MLVAVFGTHWPVAVLQVNCCVAKPPGNIPLVQVNVCVEFVLIAVKTAVVPETLVWGQAIHLLLKVN